MPQKSVLTESIGDYFRKSNLETLICKTSQLSKFFPRILFAGLLVIYSRFTCLPMLLFQPSFILSPVFYRPKNQCHFA
jgi:hypothetical protein